MFLVKFMIKFRENNNNYFKLNTFYNAALKIFKWVIQWKLKKLWWKELKQ